MSDEGNKLLVIDGHSMAFRAFYALPTESFRTSTGQYTNAVHGFTNMLLKLIREEAPTHIALAFDLDTPTFRHESYDDYKGGRDKTPAEFTGQIDLIKEVAAALNIPWSQSNAMKLTISSPPMSPAPKRQAGRR